MPTIVVTRESTINNGSNLVGDRFTSSPIPKGANIQSAFLIFTTGSGSSSGSISAISYGEDVDDSAPFVDAADLNARVKTSQSVAWNFSFTPSAEHTSPDLKTIIQHIVNRTNWQSGNDLTLLFEDNGSNPTDLSNLINNIDTAELQITYTELSSTGAEGSTSNPYKKQKNYLFVIESRQGEQKGMTEAWDFDSIVRDINGTMYCKVESDKTLDNLKDGIVESPNNLTIRISTEQTQPEGLDYFSGYMTQREINLQAGKQEVHIHCYGHISKLFQSLWRTGATIVHNYTAGDTVSGIVQDIIDHYRTLDTYAKINYSSASIEDTLMTIQTKFEAVMFGEGLVQAVKLAYTSDRTWFWRVLADNIFTLKKASQSPDHFFILEKDISAIKITDDLVNSANEYFVYYANTVTKKYADATSVTKYGNISKFTRETNANNSTTADQIGNAGLEYFTPPLYKISITVNDLYEKGIEFINPGDTCTVLNLPEVLANIVGTNMLVTKTTYKKDEVDLELSIKQPRLESAVELLKTQFETARTEGIPTTFS